MRRTRLITFSVALAFFLTGCGKIQETELYVKEYSEYQKYVYETAVVEKGDLTPEFEMTVKVGDFEKINYKVSDDSLKVDSVNVSVGDRVKKGDVLVSFRSDEIKKEIEAYQTELDNNYLLVQHYEKLMEIDKNTDYSNDIKMIKDDIEIEKVYIEEAEAKLKTYNIIAEKDGNITFIDEILSSGWMVADYTLICEATGSDDYTTSIVTDYVFSIGEILTAETEMVDYRFEITKIDIDDEGLKTLTLEPLQDMSSLSYDDSLKIVVRKDTLKDVMYVPEKAVKSCDEGSYVYRLDENGYREAVFVEISDVVSGYATIISGVNVGDEVVLE